MLNMMTEDFCLLENQGRWIARARYSCHLIVPWSKAGEPCSTPSRPISVKSRPPGRDLDLSEVEVLFVSKKAVA